MVAANSRIWRDSNTVPVSDIIDFNNTPTLPDATGAIQQTNITLTSAFSRNPKPKGKLDEIQDTGFASMDIVISGFISDPTNSGIPALIRVWLLEDKTTSTYIYGRFGFQLDDFPVYNVRPTANRGCMLTDWTWIRAGQTRGKAEFNATLRFNSNITGLNASTYLWDTT
jgi:hypothetical protein